MIGDKKVVYKKRLDAKKIVGENAGDGQTSESEVN